MREGNGQCACGCTKHEGCDCVGSRSDQWIEGIHCKGQYRVRQKVMDNALDLQGEGKSDALLGCL